MIRLLVPDEEFISFIVNRIFATKKYEDVAILFYVFKNVPCKYLDVEKSESKVRRVLGQHSITPN